jgi:adenylate cyclase
MPAPALSARCLVCGLPLTGAAGAVLAVLGVRRGARNPHCCTRCNMHIEEGRLVELTMLFADLSSFTELTDRLGAVETHRVVDKYLREAAAVLSARGAFIDKFIGDAVMAFFNVPVKRPDHAAAAVAAAQELQRRLPALSRELGQELRASIGIATGFARVGRLGSDDPKDYTAIGGVVNQAARLQAQAKAGEILVSDQAYAQVAGSYPGAKPETLTLKGFREPATAYRLTADGAAAVSGDAPPPPAGPVLGWSGFALALMGGGCLGKVFLGSAALSLSTGAGSALLALVLWLDASPLRVPVLAAASAAALASLVMAWREHRERAAAEARNGCIVATPSERRRNALVAAASLATLLVAGGELWLHRPEGRLWRRSQGLALPHER